MDRESKVYSCTSCNVEFCFTIEPAKDDDALRQNYPESLEWLSDIDDELVICPVCGERCEEV